QSFDGLPSQRFPSCSILLVPPVSGGDLNNSLKITNVSGKNVTNYPLQIGRAFMKGEIVNYPALMFQGQALPTQADIKNRYEDGSVKFAVVSAILPLLNANETITLTFANQSSGLNQSPSAAELLASGFNF